MTTTLLTALGPAWEGKVAGTVQATPEAHLVRRCADLVDLTAAAAAGLARVAVVGAGLRGLERAAVLELQAASLYVIGVHVPGDEQAQTFLERIGADTVLPADADAERWGAVLAELEECQSRVLDSSGGSAALGVPGNFEDRVTGEDPHGQVLAVWGPTGAPGRTFVACELAGWLAVSGRRVLLVDADTYGASVAQVLALLDETAGLAAAARAANVGRLDTSALAGIAAEVRPRLRVLTGLPQPDRWPELVPDVVTQVLQVARGLVDVVVVDLGFGLEQDEALVYDTRAPQRNGVTRAVLEDADQVLAVGRADPVGLQRLVRGLGELRDLGVAPVVVANRVRAAAVGQDPERAVRDALERFAAVEEVICLPQDADAVDAAILSGRLLAESRGHSELTEALAALARRLVPAAAPETVQTRRGNRSGSASGQRLTKRLGRKVRILPGRAKSSSTPGGRSGPAG